MLDWEGAVALTGTASPHAREVLEAAMRNVGAVVVLMTGDEEARLRAEFCAPDEIDTEGALKAQARPNVIFEAGLAFALFPKRTVVVQLGRLRVISDIAGVQYVPLDDSPQSRRALANRLRTAGCAIVDSESPPVAVPAADADLPPVARAGTARVTVFHTLKSMFGLPSFGGRLEITESATAGEKLTLTLHLPEATEYRVLHWMPGAATPVPIASGARASDVVDVEVRVRGPAGMHFFDLETRSETAPFMLAARARCAVAEE